MDYEELALISLIFFPLSQSSVKPDKQAVTIIVCSCHSRKYSIILVIQQHEQEEL